MISGTETVLCLVLLAFGAVGFLVAFVFTDRNAVQESMKPEHRESEAAEVTATEPAAQPKA
ncbi:MAG: hypothetical protein ACUVRU_06560 [Anaerolineae bacterium]